MVFKVDFQKIEKMSKKSKTKVNVQNGVQKFGKKTETLKTIKNMEFK